MQPTFTWHDVDQPLASEAPQSLGPFQVLGELGRGGMGVVYRARDPRAQREVALKVFSLERGELGLKRFRREAEITSGLTHPGIVRVHDVGATPRHAFIVYELIEGARTLEQAAPQLSVDARCRVLVEAARALGSAHTEGVVHRDIKPENLILDDDGRARVMDFGVATAFGLDRLTQTGVLLGTPSFMAPEQIGKASQVGPPADVWSLGVVLYWCLTDLLPFRAVTLAELMAQVRVGRSPSPRRERPGISRALDAVCARALERDPAARYRDATAFAEALEAALRGDAAPRPLGLPALAAASAALLLAGGLLVAASPGEAPPEPAQARTEAPSEPDPSTPVVASDDEAAARQRRRAERRLEKILDLPRNAQIQALETWLEENPGHPQSQEARDAISRRRFEEVHWQIERPSRAQHAPFAFWSERELVVETDRGLRVLSLRDGGEVSVRLEWPAIPSDPNRSLLRADANTLYTVSHLGDVRRYERGLEAPQRRRVDDSVQDADLAVTSDGRHLIAIAGRTLRVVEWGPDRLVERARLEPKGSPIETVELSREGRVLAYNYGRTKIGSRSGRVFCEVRSQQALYQTRFPTISRGLAAAPHDDGLFAIGNSLGGVGLEWPKRIGPSAEPKQRWMEGSVAGSVRALAFSPDGERLYAIVSGDVSPSGLIEVSLGEGAFVPGRGVPLPVRPYAIDVSPEGRWIAVGLERRGIVITSGKIPVPGSGGR